MKIQSPWMGRIKGSAGNMTGCKIYDKNVMRAKAFEVSNPNTQAQQTQRNYFASLTNLVGTFTEEQLRTLFPQKPKAMSRRNALTKQLAEYYISDETNKEVALSALHTLGNAPMMKFGETGWTVENGGITVTLDNKVKQNQEIANNYFIIALVNVDRDEIYLTTNCAAVSNGSVTITLPSTWESDAELNPIPLITNSKENVSAKGFGTFTIMVRPEK